MITELLMAAQIVSAAPPLPPAVAAQIMARLDSPANFSGRFVCTDCDGPRVIVLPANPGGGPFGPFAPFTPARRLDGSLVSSRPWRSTIFVGRPFGAQVRGDQHRREVLSPVHRPSRR